MANIKNGLSKPEQTQQVVKRTGISALMSSIDVKERFEKMLGKKAAGFMSSVITVTNNNSLLAKADPTSILSAASMAASLDLPINPNLGFAYIVPYKGQAQFQIGWRGFVQLAQRSGLYKRALVTHVYEGEIQFDRYTETFKRGEKLSDAIVGYYAMFELLNGFTKIMYVTKDEILAHAMRYSPSFKNGPWQTEFDKMAKKTVIKSLLKDWGPMSIEMQMAIESDDTQIIEKEDGTREFVHEVEVESFSQDVDETPEQEREVDPDTGELIPLDLK